ncbi:MAG: tRNA pseudouridine(55) synthase TruB [Planctomycetales bacterium]|nr:tRNA pseudouridine(55) synthase TruB [Planctomycetales bacterium]NIM09406.1 tRNA pseudouridine(55) synthase TruB [Planctomycetales bacterium]NIN08880.1 tRNA pseudouridine(55) synthase TruB [Planctomycetales bacterium]NIN77995.1 tRNA pseudouridine(55) synthase TruB [Planctomycetales bacterium]NIO35178.1 tRNA pseudouridine(55) synthase TruB [Planctomycetales bacterium]
MFGLLNINKPAGVTSRKVVDLVQEAVGTDKAGHAGTLDPLATGVIVVCVGSATRLVDYIQRMRKYYRGTFRLGCSSPSDDTETDVTRRDDLPIPDVQQLTAALRQWTGTIQQRPPAYSAVKVAGRRAYKLARQGKPVQLAARQVTVYQLALVRYDYPELVLDICCSAGTYVRSLGRDLAASLGTAAVMSALTRTAIGRFRLADAVALEDLGTHNVLQHMLPADLAVAELPRTELTSGEVARIVNGRRIEREGWAAGGEEEIAAFDTSGRLLAILKPGAAGILAPIRVFPPPAAG